MGPGEHFQFTASVSGTANTAVVWLVNNSPGGSATVGFVCPSSDPMSPCTIATAPGEYFSPATSPGSVTVTAQSGADPTHQGSATVTIGNGSARSNTSGIGYGHDRKRQRTCVCGYESAGAHGCRARFRAAGRVFVGCQLFHDEPCARGRCAASDSECDLYRRRCARPRHH